MRVRFETMATIAVISTETYVPQDDLYLRGWENISNEDNFTGITSLGSTHKSGTPLSLARYVMKHTSYLGEIKARYEVVWIYRTLYLRRKR
jgi:hypothetical protein